MGNNHIREHMLYIYRSFCVYTPTKKIWLVLKLLHVLKSNRNAKHMTFQLYVYLYLVFTIICFKGNLIKSFLVEISEITKYEQALQYQRWRTAFCPSRLAKKGGQGGNACRSLARSKLPIAEKKKKRSRQRGIDRIYEYKSNQANHLALFSPVPKAKQHRAEAPLKIHQNTSIKKLITTRRVYMLPYPRQLPIVPRTLNNHHTNI